MVVDRGRGARRSRDCDIVLGDANVSRTTEIRRPGGWTIADLGSTKGVLSTAARRGAAPLAAGDQVELGTSTLKFELERPRAARTGLSSAEVRLPDRALLFLLWWRAAP